MTAHRVCYLTTGARLLNDRLDAGVGEGWRGSRNLLSLIPHSPGLLIQGNTLNHDCVPSVEPAKKKIPRLKMSPSEQSASGFQSQQQAQEIHIKMYVHALVH